MKKLLLFAFPFIVFTGCFEKVEITSTDTTCSEKCKLTDDPGLCQAAFPRFYFDPVEKKCKPFTWGGCGTVPFETLQECEDCGCK